MKMRRFSVVALALFASLSFAQDKQPDPPALAVPDAMTTEQKQKVLDGINDIMGKRAFVPGVDFAKWPDFLAKKRADIDKADKTDVFSRAVNQVLRDFGVSHVRLLTPRQATRRTQTSTVGIGVSIAPTTDGLRIASIREGSAAESAGLKPGDVIVKVDGTVPSNEDSLSGNEGDKKTLKVKRGEKDELEVTVELKKISLVRKETLTWPKPDVALIKIFSFGPQNYDRQNVEDLVRQATPQAKSVILDLRSNGGGAINHLNHLLSQFLPASTDYGTFISRRMSDDYASSHDNKVGTSEEIAKWANRHATTKIGDGPLCMKPFVVLINRGTGSASEIAAAALRELKGAKLVGTNSAGAVLASVFGKLDQGFNIQYPISDYITIKGNRLEKNPLVPDVEVKDPATKEKDPAVEKALELLSPGS